MSKDNQELNLNAALADLRDTIHIRDSVRTALLCASMVAIGVALGVNLFTVKMLATLDLATYSTFNQNAAQLNAFYNTLMHWSLIVFAGTSIGVVLLDTELVWATSED